MCVKEGWGEEVGWRGPGAGWRVWRKVGVLDYFGALTTPCGWAACTAAPWVLCRASPTPHPTTTTTTPTQTHRSPLSPHAQSLLLPIASA